MFVYDIEIIKRIPDKNQENDSQYEYCEGWHDHENMGISVIGLYDGKTSFVFTNCPSSAYSNDFHRYPVDTFVYCMDFLRYSGQKIGGFNNWNFDDKVIESACNIAFISDFDILQQVRIAAYGSPSWKDQPPGYSYTLDAIAKANGYAKSGNGALAPKQWQDGDYGEVIRYCLNDCRITYEIVQLALSGELIDPNTGKKLKIFFD